MLSVVMLSVVMLSVIMPSVVAPILSPLLALTTEQQYNNNRKGATTFSIMTLSITTLSIMGLFATLSINDMS